MCYNCAEKTKLVQAVDSLYNVNKQHWILIKNLSNRLEVIPVTSWPLVKDKAVLIHTPAPMPETKQILTIKTKKK